MILTMNHYPWMDKRRSRNRVSYTIVLSVEKLPGILQHPIAWVGLTNYTTPMKSLSKGKVGVDTITTFYPAVSIKSIRNILD